jgi:peptidoglycan hydrolase-like protein with peptidoglycan-binding domain
MIEDAYSNQSNLLLSRLTGSALEEAMRPIERHLDLQAALARDGFLPPPTGIDGVYGPRTRAAIAAWQSGAGRSPTGLLGNDDAPALDSASPADATDFLVPSTKAVVPEDSSVLSSALGMTVSQI